MQNETGIKQTGVGPVGTTDRIASLDVLRGFAVLGILIMNIQSFSMIQGAYLNPTAFGDLSGINRWIWIASHVLAEQKFLSLFSILFGAGVYLMTSRITSRGGKPGGLHYRRTFWLLVIGLVHAYLFWHGDILVSYALCALLVYLFRNKSPKTLFILGLISVAVTSLLYLMFHFSMPYWPEESLAGLRDYWQPSGELIQKEVSALRGGLSSQMAVRVPASLIFQTFIFLVWTGWRAGGLMLAGMALFKWGVLSAQKAALFYKKMILVGFGIGLPLVSLGIVNNFAAGWVMEHSFYLGSQWNYWGSLFVATGYIGLVMLICQSSVLTRTKQILSAVGRMALSNYLAQTLICTTLFYGHGFGLFGSVERWGQILIVFGVWILQLWISPLWLKHFRFGPAEWLWRSLTYWKVQPMRQGA